MANEWPKTKVPQFLQANQAFPEDVAIWDSLMKTGRHETASEELDSKATILPIQGIQC